MFKAIVNRILKGEKGFTLIELLAVMAIIAVLATIVSTSVIGTGDASRDATAAQDAGTTQTTAGTYFADQGAAVLTTTSDVLFTKIDGATPASTAVDQVTSSVWPEAALTATYATVFDTTSGPGVSNVVLTLDDTTTLTEAVLLDDYTAISFSTMVAGGYSDQAPASDDLTLTVAMSDGTSVTVDEYLWLFRKTSSSAGTDDSRTVVVFKLTAAAEDETTTPDSLILIYEQIF